MKHFISIADTPTKTLLHMLDLAVKLREERRQGQQNTPCLAGKTLALFFEKPSLRTRVSFEQAMYELGGHAIVLDQQGVGLGVRESVADVARVLAGMVHGIAARVFEHDKLIQLTQYSDKPVINMLSDYSHPCQALADILTLMDAFQGDIAGKTVAFVGDGNNVARSLAIICAKLDVNFILACPKGYELEPDLFNRIHESARGTKSQLSTINDPTQALAQADAIYADTFTSMGQEAEKEKRLKAFSAFQLNDILIQQAPEHAIVLHCLPAYRGVEITDDVLDSSRSWVFAQAENRLHAQKGLLAHLLGGM